MTFHPTSEIAVVIAAYLIGSLSFATILVRMFRGVDVRELGSGNAGATNVLRTSGKGLAIATMALDVLKGALAVLLMHRVSFDPRWVGLAAVAAILGHTFPVFFGFRGGKGVATVIGAFLVVAPLAVAIVVGVFAIVVALTRYVSLGSVTAACVLPLSLRLLHFSDSVVLTGFAMTGLLVFSHRANIRRLLGGTERKLGQAKDAR